MGGWGRAVCAALASGGWERRGRLIPCPLPFSSPTFAQPAWRPAPSRAHPRARRPACLGYLRAPPEPARPASSEAALRGGGSSGRRGAALARVDTRRRSGRSSLRLRRSRCALCARRARHNLPSRPCDTTSSKRARCFLGMKILPARWQSRGAPPDRTPSAAHRGPRALPGLPALHRPPGWRAPQSPPRCPATCSQPVPPLRDHGARLALPPTFPSTLFWGASVSPKRVHGPCPPVLPLSAGLSPTPFLISRCRTCQANLSQGSPPPASSQPGSRLLGMEEREATICPGHHSPALLLASLAGPLAASSTAATQCAGTTTSSPASLTFPHTVAPAHPYTLRFLN